MAKTGRGIQVGLSWIPARNGRIPKNAHGGHWVPGNAVEGYKVCYYADDGKQLSSKEFELLCETGISDTKECYEWIPDSDGKVPKNAIVAGMKGDKALYIVKAMINCEPSIGKLQEGDKYACFTWTGGKVEEHRANQYDVLVFKQE
ncbi:unnamed protein product [Trichobilharzia szidati]|nr:unnamed protein product [Trichobilharzia szidati]